jgi:hypothetical protein
MASGMALCAASPRHGQQLDLATAVVPTAVASAAAVPVQSYVSCIQPASSMQELVRTWAQ